MIRRGFDLFLRENPQIGDDDLMIVTPFFLSWRHSIVDWGGNWFGEGMVPSRPKSDAFFLRHFFQTNLGRRIVAKSGGVEYSEVQIVEMELSEKGAVSVRSIENLINACKVYYTKIGDNQIVNPSVESTAWSDVGSPSTNARSTTWSSRGDYGQHIVTDGSNEGAEIEDGDSTGLSVVAAEDYSCNLDLKVVSGTWRLQVLRTDTSAVIAQRAVSGTGRTTLRCTVSSTNDYSGAVLVRLIADATGAECYADNAVFRTAGVPTETEWFTDAESIDRWGRKEMVFLEKEKSDDEADAHAQLAIDEWAWPRTRGPGQGSTFRLDELEETDYLLVTCMGLSWTLSWTYLLTDVGTGDADAAITSVLDESEFLTSADAIIDTNGAEVQLFIDDPTTAWEAIEDILGVGDGAGVPWMGGSYPTKRFVYQERPTTVKYDIRGGKLFYHRAGPVPPILAEPGWALNMDLPLDEPEVGAQDIDNPRREWLEETWFVYEDGRESIEWSTEDDSDYA